MNKKVKYKCYLAHPYEFRDSDKIGEIIKELRERGVTVINPFDGEEEMWRKYGMTGYYPNPPYKLGRDIWIKDELQVSKCDMILVYVPEGERLSGGCGIEMRKAYDWNKFIQIISMSKHPAFAYVLTGANQMFETIEDWKKMRQLRWD